MYCLRADEISGGGEKFPREDNRPVSPWVINMLHWNDCLKYSGRRQFQGSDSESLSTGRLNLRVEFHAELASTTRGLKCKQINPEKDVNSRVIELMQAYSHLSWQCS